MPDGNKYAGQSRVRMSLVQKIVIFIPVSVFIVFMGLIIHGKQPVEPGIFAMGGIIILVVLLSIIYLYIKGLVKKLDEAYEEIDLKVVTDELTQLSNRRYFETLFQNELCRAIRHERYLSCLILGIDDFKEFNDKYGHQFGDKVLQDTAEVLKDNSRVVDIIARDEGDRFICLMPETKTEAALYLAKRLRSLVEGDEFVIGKDGEKAHITISIGVASCKPCLEEEIDIYKIIDMADKALHMAKEKGRNRVESFTGE